MDKAAYIPETQWDYLQGNAGVAGAGSFSWGPAGKSQSMSTLFSTPAIHL
jgi:hypothetical protein